LVRMKIVNIGCIGPEGLVIELDNIVCLVGANNAGKSTVLRSYELAVGTETFDKERDLSNRANGQPASVELWVHIPEGTPNISEDWKTPEEALLLVRSRWEWSEPTGWKRTRMTWDPTAGAFATNEKASGLDTVFESRLPKPFRIGTLEDPKGEHKRLLTLVLQPVAEKLREQMRTADSALAQAVKAVTDTAEAPVGAARRELNEIKETLNRSHNRVFPDLQIDFEIGLGELAFDPAAQLLAHSELKFQEWTSEVRWHQQGTGSQRALFWTMLQVRSRLNALSDIAAQRLRKTSECRKEIAKCEKELLTLKQTDAKQKRQEAIDKLHADLARLNGTEPEAALAEQAAEFALPGYMLLIDEPEVALHPGAVRAASSYLYGLAEDPAWQVMLTTHSPAFIDPLQDHTTIVRLDRDATRLTPSTYRADSAGFETQEKEQLKMLLRFDSGLAEMFFGQFPVLVEGDTEFAAFETVMNMNPDDFPAAKRPVLVRARGKSALGLVIKMLKHFKVSFAVLHDADSPRRRDNKANSAWTANGDLHQDIKKTREAGVRVVHRVSVPYFEMVHLSDDTVDEDLVRDARDKEKPWRARQAVISNPAVETSVRSVLDELTSKVAREEPFEGDFADGIKAAVQTWAAENAPDDVRYKFA
jgi:putative ATP-dependent endonuclease of the OLD family